MFNVEKEMLRVSPHPSPTSHNIVSVLESVCGIEIAKFLNK
jgi:hypothetical protein